MRGCPCYKCEKRYEACHDYCDKYKAWKKPIADSYEERVKAVDRRMINDRMYNIIDRKTKQNMKRK